MDTNNLDKWWYGLPENTRQAIGNDEIWEKLDMPSRSALHRYSLLRIYGTAKDRRNARYSMKSRVDWATLPLSVKTASRWRKCATGTGNFTMNTRNSSTYYMTITDTQ